MYFIYKLSWDGQVERYVGITTNTIMMDQDRIDMAGMQIIGWDPAAKQIRSWVFDSDGAFGEGVWNKQGNRWYIQSTGTLARRQQILVHQHHDLP